MPPTKLPVGEVLLEPHSVSTCRSEADFILHLVLWTGAASTVGSFFSSAFWQNLTVPYSMPLEHPQKS